MNMLLAILLALTLPAPLPLQLQRDGRQVVVSWPALPGQAQADVTVWRSDATALTHVAGPGPARVVAACGDRILINVWSSEPRLLATATATAPCALWLPAVRVGRGDRRVWLPVVGR